MRLSFRSKLMLGYVVLVIGVLVVVDLHLHDALSSDLADQLDRRLERHGREALGWLSDGAPPAQVAARVGQAAEARVTIIGRDGRVLADSDVEDAQAMENHANRPDVAAARRDAVGRATRWSSTLGESMRYLAVAAPDGPTVRLAVSRAAADATVRALRRRLVVASVIALLVAIFLGQLIGTLAVRPLRAMTEAAARLARGEFSLQLPATGRDEFGALARALTSLSGQLEDRIGELTAARDRLAAMLEAMTEGVLVLNPQGVVVIANRAAADILEGSPALAGRTIAEVIRHPAARSAAERALAGEQPDPVELEPTGGRARAVSFNVHPLPLGAGRGAVAVLHDVTHLRRLENVRRDFASNVSHELRTPVASIQSYAETLLDGALAEPPTARKFVEVIHRNASRIGRLVGDLLTLSRLEARAPAERRTEPIALRDLTEQVAATVAERAAVGVEVAAELHALGDPDGVEQILLNLVDNGIRHGRPGGRLSIGAARAGAAVELWVEDDGPGIESRHLPRLFERFYRVDPGRSRDQGGTGLGLAIVKHLAESMGGTVAVRSEVGRGSRFTIVLPAAE